MIKGLVKIWTFDKPATSKKKTKVAFWSFMHFIPITN